MDALTESERTVLRELIRLAGDDGVVTGIELLDQGFADFIAQVYGKRLGYPGSLQSRVFQLLRDKGYIKMERRNRGTYTMLAAP
jgi:hypothetical protein